MPGNLQRFESSSRLHFNQNQPTMKHYAVTFEFMEFGHKCKTTWGGPAKSKEDAEKIARDWYGFEKDNIPVLSCTVEEL